MKVFTAAAACFVLLGLAFVGCSSDNSVQPSTDQIALEKKPVDPPSTGEGSFTIEAKYTYVRSYPGGGGIYVLRLLPGADMTGDVAVSVDAHKSLGAKLTTPVVNADEEVFELTLSPTQQIPFGTHVITVIASNQTYDVSVPLEVEVVSWGIVSMGVAQEKHSEFVDWLGHEHPELGNFQRERWDIYGTYPRILVVEHYTFLSDNWEFRICFHVMIPPHDWSKMCLRPRGEWDATFAAVKEWSEASQTYEFFEIPVEDYPILEGY